jgi:flagellar biosynthesis/type III secretory pathway M-ring protein FliF/YscJ
MDVIGPDWLQGGALFLAALVLWLGYRWIRDRMARDEERQVEQVQFMRDMMVSATEERKEQAEAFRILLAENIASQETCNSALQEIGGSIAEVNKALKRTCDLHKEVLRAVKRRTEEPDVL